MKYLMSIRTVSLLSVCVFIGCAGGPHSTASRSTDVRSSQISAIGQDNSCAPGLMVKHGSANRFVDGAGWILGIPSKVLLWDRRVNNHDVSSQTTAEVVCYAEQNNLQDVCVRVNQYAPVDEWRRLRGNERVSPGWRYTMGTLSLVGYTLIPGRLFGGDEYNPYTNSVYLYSDVPSLAMQATAYAKDVQGRELPGTYAAVNQLPVISLWHESIATEDVLVHLEQTGTYEQQVEGLRILYPHYGSRVGGSMESVVGVGPVLQIGGAVVGHVAGRYRASELSPAETTATAHVENEDVENDDGDNDVVNDKTIRLTGHATVTTNPDQPSDEDPSGQPRW